MRERTLIAGRYEVRAPLGRGGMAEVWDSYDQRLDRRVAVKVVRRSGLPQDSDYDRAVQRFSREARVTAKLEHPGVPTVYDVGTHDGEAYLVMQLVAGHNLGDAIAERGPFPVAWAAAIGAQICSVLANAHAGGMVHRDLKPSNIMLCPDGSVKVLDFGIAAVLEGLDLVKLTTTGHPLGSPAYMAPEQITGDQVGPATDLYALGCVLHELLAGDRPFRAELPVAVLTAHLNHPPPPLRSVRPDVPQSLERLVLHLLAKGARERPPGAAEVYHQLVPLVAEAGAGADSTMELGPTRPYHFPLGPLPVLRVRRTASPPPPPPPLTRPESDAVLEALHQQRHRAVGLVDQGRVTHAGQVLADATQAAAAALGTDHPDVVDARQALAHLHLLANDHRRALRELRALVPDLLRHYAADHDFVWGAKRGIATCHAALGEYGEARSVLRELLQQWGHTRDPRHPELRELQEELSRLEGTSW